MVIHFFYCLITQDTIILDFKQMEQKIYQVYSSSGHVAANSILNKIENSTLKDSMEGCLIIIKCKQHDEIHVNVKMQN